MAVGYASDMALKSKQKYVRTKLNAGQIELLELVYKYRFISRQLVADCLNITYGSSIYEKLEVLVKGDFLGKRFDKRLKLQAVPAAYYLTPKGIRYLQNQPEYDFILDSAIKNSYKDKTVGQDFISHTLDVCKYTNAMKRHHPGLKVFTRRDMSRYNYFPLQPPDAFLSLPNDTEQPKRFFFDLISDNVPRLAIDHRIANYCEFFDEGGWDVTGSEWPVLLLLCERTATEKRMQRYVRAALNRLDMEEELSIYTTAVSMLENADELAAWTNIEDTDELTTLSSL